MSGPHHPNIHGSGFGATQPCHGPGDRPFCSRVEQSDRRVTYAPSSNETIRHGRYGAEGQGEQLFLDGRLRPVGDSASEFTLTTDLNLRGIKSVELVDAFVPAVAGFQHVYLDVSVGRRRIELVQGAEGERHTAIVPLSHARNGFVSLREATGRRYIHHFTPHLDSIGNEWRVRLRLLDPATGTFVNYPLPDTLDHADNVGITLEFIDFHG